LVKHRRRSNAGCCWSAPAGSSPGGVSVTDAGFQAGYGSTQAFSRAFSRAYAVTPSRFARDGGDFRIAAPNGIHFHPPAGLLLPGDPRRGTVDLTDRLLEHDQWLTGRLLDHAAELPDETLDHQVRPGHEVLSFDGPEPTVRAMLDRLVWTKEVWTAAIGGRDLPDGSDRSIDGLRARLAAAGEEFLAMARRIRDGDQWDDVFVDAMCDPPQSFTFGGVIAHVITFSAYRRQVLLAVPRHRGHRALVGDRPGGAPARRRRRLLLPVDRTWGAPGQGLRASRRRHRHPRPARSPVAVPGPSRQHGLRRRRIGNQAGLEWCAAGRAWIDPRGSRTVRT